jgi:hypothetical protein
VLSDPEKKEIKWKKKEMQVQNLGNEETGSFSSLIHRS